MPAPKNPVRKGKAAPKRPPVPLAGPPATLEVDWAFFGELCRALALKVARDFDPEVVLGIAKAGDRRPNNRAMHRARFARNGQRRCGFAVMGGGWIRRNRQEASRRPPPRSRTPGFSVILFILSTGRRTPEWTGPEPGR